MNALRSPALAFPLPALAAWLLRLALLAGSLACWGPAPAAAQTGAADPPGRVARLSEVTGPAWLFHPDDGDWVEAVRNLPLTTGDRLATDPNTRAELQVGSTTLRLDGGSELEVVALDDTRIALQLRAGALVTRVRNAAEAGQVDVLTDDGRFLVLRAGSYRFDRGTRSSIVLVDAGEVRYEQGGSALNVGPGQRGEFWIDPNGAAQYALLAPVADAFTAWNGERERAVDMSASARYASPEMTGVQDLDRYGTWEQTPDYGAVWFPTAVGAGWAPYSSGRWAWVRPWGWTWVDDAPWGFAPFHYGRWVNVRNRWCWTPGVRQPRPVWAPALVGWVGGGPPSGGLRGAGGPAVGWFPLAPREVYLPGYASTPRYIRNINQTNVGNPNLVTAAINDPRSARDFQNRRFPNAVTIVSTTVLTERRPVGPGAAQFRNAPWARDFAQQSGAGRVSTLPPVGPPSTPPVGELRRPVRPPPGFTDERGGRRDGGFAERDAGRPAVQTPAIGPGDPRLTQRGDRDRNGVPDRIQPGGAGRAPGSGFGSPAQIETQTPATLQPGAARGLPQGQPPAGLPARAPQARGEGLDAAAPQGVAPADAQSPRMRTLPIRREEDRRIGGDRPAGRPPQVDAPAPPIAPTVRPQFNPPAPPIAPVRPIESPRAPERIAPIQPVQPQVVAPRPVEAQSPRLAAPQRAPEGAGARPVEAPRPAESPRVGGPERRNDPGNR